MVRCIMARGRITAALAASMAVALLASQAGAAPEAEDEIVVQGQRLVVQKAIRHSVRDAGIEQLARFEEPICPHVTGLPQESAKAIDRILRDNVAALGGKSGKPGCAVNAVVVFDDQPLEFVKASARSQPAYFSSMTPREYDQFTARPRPVLSWHVTEIRDRDGKEMGDSDKASQMEKIGTALVTRSVAISADVNRQAAATRLYSNTRQDMTMGVVVIDRQESAGKSARQLADLATLHLLLDVRQDPPEPNHFSILSLFDPRAGGALPPAEMTRFDHGMLRGLYTGRANNLSAGQQFSNIAKAVKRSSDSASAQ